MSHVTVLLGCVEDGDGVLELLIYRWIRFSSVQVRDEA